MHRKFWLLRTALILTCALLLVLTVACGGSGGTKVLYVVGPSTPSVVTMNVSAGGALSATSTPADTGANPDAMVVDPQGKFAFVADTGLGSGAGGISQYNVAKNGQMTAITNSTSTSAVGTPLPPVPSGTNPIAMAINGNGTLLFVANQGSNNVSVYQVDRSLGTLTEVTGSPFAAGTSPSGIALGATTVYVSNAGSGTISAFSFDASGALKPLSGSPFPAGVNPKGLAISTDGSFLYAADPGSNGILGFSVAGGGGLTPISGSPFASGTQPVSVAVDSSKFVFAANSGSGNVSMFTIGNSGTLAAVSGSPFAAGASPSFVTTDSTGSFLFVANAGGGNVSSFAIKGSSLTAVSGSPFGVQVVNPVWLVSIH